MPTKKTADGYTVTWKFLNKPTSIANKEMFINWILRKDFGPVIQSLEGRIGLEATA